MASSRISDEEWSRLQSLSAGYAPDIEGPLVGCLQSTELLIAEYGLADPTYQAKTLSLSQTFARYRQLKGDGNCGWRAISFAYFEVMQCLGDPEKFRSEEARLRSINNLLIRTGYDEYTFEGFADETFDLLRKTSSALPCHDSGAALLAAFNDLSTSSSIITHFRLMASAWMASHADAYQPFLLDQTVDEYRATTIDPYQVEMEEPGLRAVYDAIIKPAGIGIDIAYLDRSFGNVVNVHSWRPDDTQSIALGSNIPIIRLLYKIGHFDLLYKSEDFVVNSLPSFDNTYLNLDRPLGIEPHDDNRVPDLFSICLAPDDDNSLTKINSIMWPGMSYALPGHPGLPPNSYLDFPSLGISPFNMERLPGSLDTGSLELFESAPSTSQLPTSIGTHEPRDLPIRFSTHMRPSPEADQNEQQVPGTTDEDGEHPAPQPYNGTFEFRNWENGVDPDRRR